jgi:hypothetical protein
MRSVLRICTLTFVFTNIGLFAQKAPVQQNSSGENSPNIANVAGDVNLPGRGITPQLSTADKVAIQAIQKVQVDAAKEWQDAEQQKLTVLREWQMSHPGFHVHYNPQSPNDPQNYAVEADAGPASPSRFSPKPPEKTPETPKK